MKRFILAILFFPFALSADEVAVPHRFEAGMPAVAAEVNDNFEFLASELAEARASLGESEERLEAQESLIESFDEEIAVLKNQLPVVLDPEASAIEITQPGFYVLNQDFMGSLAIAADDVLLDMRNYAIRAVSGGYGLRVSGFRVEIRNASLWDAPSIVEESAQVRIVNAHFRGLTLQGSTTIVDSSAGGYIGATVSGGRHVFRNVSFSGREGPAIRVEEGSIEVLDSTLKCLLASCLELQSSGHLVSGNVISPVVGRGIDLRGDSTIVKDNLFISSDPESAGPIFVQGTDNLIIGNVSKPRIRDGGYVSRWSGGIAFTADGNYYGNNKMAAETPFSLGSTTQIDLGGNEGF